MLRLRRQAVKSSYSPMRTPIHKDNQQEATPSTSQFLKDLPPELVYAIERGLPETDQPLISDLDIVITKRGFLTLYEIAKQRGMVVSVTLSYGGARLFIACHGGIKRIDCMWNCSYLGIPICSTQRLLAARQLDPNTGLYILAEDMQAEIAFAVKNAYGGAEKYRVLLERHGLQVLSPNARRRWLISQTLRHPLATLTGLCRMILTYTTRIAFPSGVRVFGASATELMDSDVLRYLFQGRIRKTGQIHGFIRSRLGSELCVVQSIARADIDLSVTENLQAAERAVQLYLREHQSRMPSLIVAIS